MDVKFNVCLFLTLKLGLLKLHGFNEYKSEKLHLFLFAGKRTVKFKMVPYPIAPDQYTSYGSSYLIAENFMKREDSFWKCLYPNCTYRDYFKTNTLRHVRTHTGEKPFTCHLCDYQSSQRHHLLRHIKHMYIFGKNHTKFVFTILESKQNLHLRYQIIMSLCGKKDQSGIAVSQTVRILHLKRDTLLLIFIDIQERNHFLATFAGFRFAQSNNLYRHIKSKHKF
ncbi:hypothetical protein Avbf_00626 [Armadillidium vulgare]|nr:hypothetical protein Avbf_00626 [Armadillidium vulgare]